MEVSIAECGKGYGAEIQALEEGWFGWLAAIDKQVGLGIEKCAGDNNQRTCNQYPDRSFSITEKESSENNFRQEPDGPNQTHYFIRS